MLVEMKNKSEEEIKERMREITMRFFCEVFL